MFDKKFNWCVSVANGVLIALALLSNIALAQFDPAGLRALLNGELDSEAVRSRIFQYQNNGEGRRSQSPVDRSRNVGGNPESFISSDSKSSVINRALYDRKNILYDEDLSRLERDYNLRFRNVGARDYDKESRYAYLTGSVIRQYGYQTFESKDKGLNRQSIPAVGAIGNDYKLGIGDELVFVFSGSKKDNIVTEVDSEGRIILPEIGPISAAGRPFEEFKRDFQRVVKDSLIGAKVSISVGKLKQINVLVSGAVESPGRYSLTPFATVFDALIASDGVDKRGSLRKVKIVSRNTTRIIDIYNQINGESTADISLSDGDRVVIPLLGPTMAVAGDVVRPGVFELGANERKITVRKLLALAGGPLRPRGSEIQRVSIGEDGRDNVQTISDNSSEELLPGDILVVRKGGMIRSGGFQLVGHVHNPGVHSIDSYRTLGALLRAGDLFLKDPYLLFAAVSRADSETQARQWIPLDLASIVSGRLDFEIKEGDIVAVLSKRDVEFINSSEVAALLSRQPKNTDETEEGAAEKYATPVDEEIAREKERADLLASLRGDAPDIHADSCTGMLKLAQILGRDDGKRFGAARRATTAGYSTVLEAETPCPPLFQKYPALLLLGLEHSVALSGEVRIPGAYPIAGGVDLSTLISVSGGLTRQANRNLIKVSRSSIDLSSGKALVKRINMSALDNKAQIQLMPGDFIQFSSIASELEAGPVLLTGEFELPGVYDISRGETLSSVVERAGGISESGYPYGAVFTRLSIQDEERRWINRRIEDIENAMVLAVGKAQSRGKPVSGALELMQSIAARLDKAEPVGRMVVEADPATLLARPQEDLVLQPGDRLHMPKRPSHVNIVGEVLSAGAMQYSPSLTVSDYIATAGGMRESADEDRIFVILPNGTAQPVDSDWWRHESVRVPPGSTVMVPRDPVPFDLFAFSLDLADLLSKLAVSAAAINSLND